MTMDDSQATRTFLKAVNQICHCGLHNMYLELCYRYQVQGLILSTCMDLFKLITENINLLVHVNQC